VVSATVLGTNGADKDTRQIKSGKTASMRAVPLRPPLAENAGGLGSFILANRTPLTEVWQATAADGSPKLVKVVFGFHGASGDAIARLTALSHPILPPFQVVQHAPGRLVIATDPPERTLRECLQEAQAAGEPGLARACLLADLHALAEGLDALRREHGLQHLGLNPRTLLLADEQIQLADFGLAQLLWLPAGQAVAPLNARYSAPELFAKRVSPACDQYSLALIYHELLTGALPCVPAAKGQPAAPCLDGLPEADRPIVARALAPDPQRRWSAASIL